MSKDARNQDMDLPPEAREQFDALVETLAKHGFGEDGPPRETTFSQIEQFGHQAGQMVARAIDAELAQQHAAHFTDEDPPRIRTSRRMRQLPSMISLQPVYA